MIYTRPEGLMNVQIPIAYMHNCYIYASLDVTTRSRKQMYYFTVQLLTSAGFNNQQMPIEKMYMYHLLHCGIIGRHNAA